MEEHTIPTLRVERFRTDPLITPASSPALGDNINGPSVIRVPDWLPNPLGRYYVYFAHHAGTYSAWPTPTNWKPLENPRTRHAPPERCPSLLRPLCVKPDVHQDNEAKQIRMYFHGPAKARLGQ